MDTFPADDLWLFWEVDAATLDVERDAGFIMPRVLEHGTMASVRWLLEVYGAERIHAFFARCRPPGAHAAHPHLLASDIPRHG